MSPIPTQPTISTIVQEGLKRGGYPSGGSSAQQTQAQDWVEQTKWDIWTKLNGRKAESLMTVAYGVTADGVSRYALPADCEDIYSITILDALHTGTAQAVTASQVTLAAAEDVSEDFIQGKLLLLTSGTGIGNCSQVSAYNTTTKVATLTPNFNGASFAGTEGYMIVDSQYKLQEKMISIRDNEEDYSSKDRPTYYFPIGQANADSDETGEFELFQVPDDVYGIQLRYYVNLPMVDLTGNLMKTLYRRWYNLWVQGVIWRSLQQDKDTQYSTEFEIYQKMIADMIGVELYESSLMNLQAKVTA